MDNFKSIDLFDPGVIREIIGVKVILIDPAEETVQQIKKILFTKNLLFNGQKELIYKLFTLGDPTKFKTIAEQLIKRKTAFINRVNSNFIIEKEFL